MQDDNDGESASIKDSGDKLIKEGSLNAKKMIVKGNWCDHLLGGIGLWHPMVSNCHYMQLSNSNPNKKCGFQAIHDCWNVTILTQSNSLNDQRRSNVVSLSKKMMVWVFNTYVIWGKAWILSSCCGIFQQNKYAKYQAITMEHKKTEMKHDFRTKMTNPKLRCQN